MKLINCGQLAELSAGSPTAATIGLYVNYILILTAVPAIWSFVKMRLVRLLTLRSCANRAVTESALCAKTA